MPREVVVLLIARFVNRLGGFSMPFLAVLLVHAHGASVVMAGVVVGAFGMATIPSRLLGGHLAARLGAKAAVVIGLCGTAIAQLLIATAWSLIVAMAGAVLLGLCFEIYEPACQGLIADITPDAALPRAYGLLGAMLSLAALGAGLIAAGVGRIGLHWLFVVDAATALLCALLVAVRLQRLPPRAGRAPRMARAWTDPLLLALMATGTAFASVYVVVPMALPIALDAAGRDASEAGLLEALGALVIVIAQALLRGGARAESRMAWGYGLVAIGLVVPAVQPTIIGYTASTVIVACGDVVLLGYTYTVVARLAPEGAKAAYFSVYGITWGIGLTIGPPLMGLMFEAGPRTFWLFAALTMLVAGGGQFLIAGAVRRRLLSPPG